VTDDFKDNPVAIELHRAVNATVGAVLGFVAAKLFIDLGFTNILSISGFPILAVATPLGAIIGGLDRSRWLLVADVPLIALYFLVAGTPMMGAFARSWVRNDGFAAGPVDAIVILSSGLTTDTVLEATSTSRLLTGLDLFSRGVASRVVTTHVQRQSGAGSLSSIPDQRRLLRLAHAESSWVSLAPVQTTRDEADRAARILLPRGVKRIALVTSPLHTRRACATFERTGFSVVCVPARERDNDRWHPATADDRLASFTAYVYERLGSWRYRRKGWL
jgi:uncharacterized SAM-binding protein YcdF (DUF218 family)